MITGLFICAGGNLMMALLGGLPVVLAVIFPPTHRQSLVEDRNGKADLAEDIGLGTKHAGTPSLQKGSFGMAFIGSVQCPGMVARCCVCQHILLRLANVRQRVFLDMRGITYLSLSPA